MILPSKIFVTGTDTDVGKTIVSAILVAGLKAAYWKPVQAGTVEPTDQETVKKLSRLSNEFFLPESYSFRTPCSPHLAAQLENKEIKMDHIELPEMIPTKFLIIEGAGGVLVPLNQTYLMIDLMEKLNVPILIVARSSLGTINHTLLTIQALQQKQLPILGIVMVGELNIKNKEAIERYSSIPVIAQIEHFSSLENQNFEELYHKFFVISSK